MSESKVKSFKRFLSTAGTAFVLTVLLLIGVLLFLVWFLTGTILLPPSEKFSLFFVVFSLIGFVLMTIGVHRAREKKNPSIVLINSIGFLLFAALSTLWPSSQTVQADPAEAVLIDQR